MTAERYRMRRDSEGSLHRVVTLDGMEGFVSRWTDSCSGCFETGDYGGGAENYPWDAKANCRVGAGCHECGYTGKRVQEHWEPFDLAAYAEREDRRERRRARWLAWLFKRKAAAKPLFSKTETTEQEGAALVG